MSRLRNPSHMKRAQQFAADAALAALAFALAFKLRFLDVAEGIPEHYEDMLAGSIAFVAIGQALVLDLFGQHQKWWRYFRLPDLWPLVRAVFVAVALLVLVFAVAKPYADDLPRSVVVFDFLLRTVLVVGAGSGGQMVVRELQLNPNLGARAIGFVDDDPAKRGMHSQGLKVLGTTDDIGGILDRTKPEEVIIAIPSAPGMLRAKVVTAARERDVRVQTLPTVFELLRGGVQLTRQLREVQVEDVLGRDPVVMELDRVGAYLRDRKVLVTGAGGSIGTELCRQISRVSPRQLIALDHAEGPLFEIERELLDQWHFTAVEAVLADCKEGDRILEVMQRFKPDVVFHAAAYKHVALMESNPLEAVRNNAIATRVVAENAAAAGVERFVLVSTDKAVNPHTVMGASKAMAEWIVDAAGQRHPTTRFQAVRFGNVLASSGSVVPIFRTQIERGGPVTVTHPEMTRYFMTIHEAVQLVIQAGDLGASSGEVFVLEMGEPVRILDLARNMIHLAGYEPDRDIAVEFTGPRPGEKIAEELFNADERSQPTTADRILRAVREQPLDPHWVETTVQRLESLVASGDEAGLADRVVEVVSERRTESFVGHEEP